MLLRFIRQTGLAQNRLLYVVFFVLRSLFKLFINVKINIMQLETEISPIDGLDKEQFEKIRGQIIEYIKMYRTDGEPIGAWKILRYLQPYFKKDDTPKLGSKGKIGIVYNWNQPHILKPVDCELLAIYKDGRIVVQCYDIHGEKWESETFSRIENFRPNN